MSEVAQYLGHLNTAGVMIYVQQTPEMIGRIDAALGEEFDDYAAAFIDASPRGRVS